MQTRVPTTPGRAPIDATGLTLRPAEAGAPAQADSRSLSDALTMAAQGRVTEVPAEDVEVAPGTEIQRYRIVARVGAGGMGVVYRAHDAQLDRDVALKLMRVGEGGTDGRARMLREAQAAAKIRHPNVVTVYDAGEVMGRVFIAMELIDGVTLKAHFRGRVRAWREVVAVLLGAGEGLAAAHAVGLVHRDFKPDNVLVETGGRVRVLDFGLARPAYDVEGPTLKATAASHGSEAPVLRTLTQTGTVVGTPAYMAPEQHLGRGVDARTDQFSFCVTLFECLFKQRPFAGDTQAELTMNVVEGRLLLPADRGDVPQELIALLQRGLATEPSARHSSLADMLSDLRQIVRRHEPRDWRPLLIVAVLAVLAGGAAVLMTMGQGDDDERDEAVEVKEVAAAPSSPIATPGEAPVIARKPAQVTIAATAAEANELANLLRQILPQGTIAEAVPEGIALVGPKAMVWRDAANTLTAVVHGRPSKVSGGLVDQVSTPGGMVAIYAFAAADMAGKIQAIDKLDGVQAIAGSEALQVALVVGTPAGLQATEKWVREARASKAAREHCFRLHNEAELGEEVCHPSKALCEADASSWLGGTKKRCYAKK